MIIITIMNNQNLQWIAILFLISQIVPSFYIIVQMNRETTERMKNAVAMKVEELEGDTNDQNLQWIAILFLISQIVIASFFIATTPIRTYSRSETTERTKNAVAMKMEELEGDTTTRITSLPTTPRRSRRIAMMTPPPQRRSRRVAMMTPPPQRRSPP